MVFLVNQDNRLKVVESLPFLQVKRANINDDDNDGHHYYYSYLLLNTVGLIAISFNFLLFLRNQTQTKYCTKTS